MAHAFFHQDMKLFIDHRVDWPRYFRLLRGAGVDVPGEIETYRSILSTLGDICEDIEAGAILTTANLRAIRPGFGLAPKYLDSVLGLRVGRSVKRGTAMSWELLSPT